MAQLSVFFENGVAWLNTNAGAIQALATIVLVVVGWQAFRAASAQAKAARKAVDAAGEAVAETRRQSLAQSIALFDVALLPQETANGQLDTQVTIENLSGAPAFDIGAAFWSLPDDGEPPTSPGFMTTSLASLAPGQRGLLIVDSTAYLVPGRHHPDPYYTERRFLVRIRSTSSLGAVSRMDFVWDTRGDRGWYVTEGTAVDRGIDLVRVRVDLGGTYEPIIWPSTARKYPIRDPW